VEKKGAEKGPDGLFQRAAYSQKGVPRRKRPEKKQLFEAKQGEKKSHKKRNEKKDGGGGTNRESKAGPCALQGIRGRKGLPKNEKTKRGDCRVGVFFRVVEV